MSTRRTWTPAEMRALAKAGGTDISIGQMRGALAYAADVIESGAAVIAELMAEKAEQPTEESSAELALRRLAIWLGVGVDNGPIVDFRGLEEKIRWSVAYLIDANAAPLPAEGDQHD